MVQEVEALDDVPIRDIVGIGHLVLVLVLVLAHRSGQSEDMVGHCQRWPQSCLKSSSICSITAHIVTDFSSVGRARDCNWIKHLEVACSSQASRMIVLFFGSSYKSNSAIYSIIPHLIQSSRKPIQEIGSKVGQDNASTWDVISAR